MLPCDPGRLHGILFCLSAVVFLAALADGCAASLVLAGDQLLRYALRKCIGALPHYGENGNARQNIYGRYLPLPHTTDGL